MTHRPPPNDFDEVELVAEEPDEKCTCGHLDVEHHRSGYCDIDGCFCVQFEHEDDELDGPA